MSQDGQQTARKHYTLTIESPEGEVKKYSGVSSMLLICTYVDNDGTAQPLRIVPANQIEHMEFMAIAQQWAGKRKQE